LIPGYVIIKPGFPECIDDFGVLWFEDAVAGSANWVVADNAADASITARPATIPRDKYVLLATAASSI
jgi:aminoglycoside/choline kinase family phosphotransferase